MPKEPVTRNDVAAYAGVSTAVVSYVVNEGPRKVAPETRDRVLTAIRVLGYRPNATARALRMGTTRTFGLITPDGGNPLFAELAKAIDKEAAARGYVVLQTSADGDPETERAKIAELLTRQVSGLVLVAPTADPDLSAAEVPAVAINRVLPTISSIRPAYREGARRGVAHLINHGHQNIALVIGDPHPNHDAGANPAPAREVGGAGAMPARQVGGGAVPAHDAAPAREVHGAGAVPGREVHGAGAAPGREVHGAGAAPAREVHGVGAVPGRKVRGAGAVPGREVHGSGAVQGRPVGGGVGPGWGVVVGRGGGVERELGWRDALRAAGLAAGPVVRAAFSRDGGRVAGEKLLAATERPTAVFASSDLQAIGVLRAVHEAGLRVPEDIAVVAFDGTPETEYCWPPLTVVRQPLELLAREAVNRLIEGEQTVEALTLPTELILRKSCGC
ncbi:hypothetical protein GCM10009804_03640 [Kribbella hippodromi]|uniref:HTH lacI-type domain-containing protein n=1 Tax=Kribbella hippodromi TaxID=434347 RepID=A0ABP4MUF2_9ACTN